MNIIITTVITIIKEVVVAFIKNKYSNDNKQINIFIHKTNLVIDSHNTISNNSNCMNPNQKYKIVIWFFLLCSVVLIFISKNLKTLFFLQFIVFLTSLIISYLYLRSKNTIKYKYIIYAADTLVVLYIIYYCHLETGLKEYLSELCGNYNPTLPSKIATLLLIFVIATFFLLSISIFDFYNQVFNQSRSNIFLYSALLIFILVFVSGRFYSILNESAILLNQFIKMLFS